MTTKIFYKKYKELILAIIAISIGIWEILEPDGRLFIAVLFLVYGIFNLFSYILGKRKQI